MPATLTHRELVLLLIAREELAGDDGISAVNLLDTFTEFDLVPVLAELCEAGAVTVSRPRDAWYTDWRDGGNGVAALMTHPDTVIRVDRGVDDLKEGMV